jgi:hypothetical protein
MFRETDDHVPPSLKKDSFVKQREPQSAQMMIGQGI